MGLVHEVSGPIICMHLLISLHVSFFQNSVKKTYAIMLRGKNGNGSF